MFLYNISQLNNFPAIMKSSSSLHINLLDKFTDFGIIHSKKLCLTLYIIYLSVPSPISPVPLILVTQTLHFFIWRHYFQPPHYTWISSRLLLRRQWNHTVFQRGINSFFCFKIMCLRVYYDIMDLAFDMGFLAYFHLSPASNFWSVSTPFPNTDISWKCTYTAFPITLFRVTFW